MKIAVITGASSGIGREFARQIPKLYRNLDELWIMARREDRLEALKEELEGKRGLPARIFAGDLETDDLYERIARELEDSRPDIRMLVNAAGYGKIGSFLETEEREIAGQVELNCKALTRMLRLCVPYMSRGSRIINAASAAAFAPQPGFAVYAATKSYVYSLSLALGEEWKDRGITVTALCPGPVDTEFFQRSGEFSSGLGRGRKALPREVARQGLLDSVRGKSVSVYGAPMKAARIGAGLIPAGICARVMKKINQSGVERYED